MVTRDMATSISWTRAVLLDPYQTGSGGLKPTCGMLGSPQVLNGSAAELSTLITRYSRDRRSAYFFTELVGISRASPLPGRRNTNTNGGSMKVSNGRDSTTAWQSVEERLPQAPVILGCLGGFHTSAPTLVGRVWV
jgi:hypothetical protein